MSVGSSVSCRGLMVVVVLMAATMGAGADVALTPAGVWPRPRQWHVSRRGMMAAMAHATIPGDGIAELGTILSIWAHPDDETYLAAGVMAAAADRGARRLRVGHRRRARHARP